MGKNVAHLPLIVRSTVRRKHFANIRQGYRLSRKWAKMAKLQIWHFSGVLYPKGAPPQIFLRRFVVPLKIYKLVTSQVSSSYQSQKHRKCIFA